MLVRINAELVAKAALVGALSVASIAGACTAATGPAGRPTGGAGVPPEARVLATAAAGTRDAAGNPVADPGGATSAVAGGPGAIGAEAGLTGAPPTGGTAPAGHAAATNQSAGAGASGAGAADAGAAQAFVPGTPSVSIPANETIVAIATVTPSATAPPPPTATATPGSGGAPMLGGCPMFPADNPWNADISAMPVDANSATYIGSIGAGGFLHADFGGGGAYGIPYIIVPQSQPQVPIVFTAYGNESDPGPYPVPLAPVEQGSDAHVLALQQGTCKLFEMFNAHPNGGVWNADSDAIFDLRSNALRPQTWTSAVAAGLPILPGLVRYDEVQAGQINHALRFTVNTVQRAWIDPATHYGTSTSTARPAVRRETAAQAVVQHLGLSGRGARRAGGAAQVRHDRRRPGFKLVHHRRRRPALGRQ